MDLPQIIPVDKLNRNKEYARYTFQPSNGAWAVYRRGKYVGAYSAQGFEPVKGYDNLRQFVGEALKRQYESAQKNQYVTNGQTLQMFGIRVTV